MDITLDNFFKYSFVITIDDKRLSMFFNELIKKEIIFKPTIYSGKQIKFIQNRWAKSDEQKIQNYNKWHYGCSVSHYEIIKIAKMMDYPYVVIFEDDILPIKDLKNKLEFYLTDIPETIDILTFGTTFQIKCSNSLKYVNGKNNPGTTAYMVFNHSYNKYLNILQTSNDIIYSDGMFKYFNTIRTSITLFLQQDLTGNVILADKIIDKQNLLLFK